MSDRPKFEPNPFHPDTIAHLEAQLNRLSVVIPIGWEFSDLKDRLALIFEFDIDGPGTSEVILTNHKAAKAFVDSALIFYNIGFGHGIQLQP